MTKPNPEKMIDAAARAYQREADQWFYRDARWLPGRRSFEVCRHKSGRVVDPVVMARCKTDATCESEMIRLRGRAAMKAAMRVLA